MRQDLPREGDGAQPDRRELLRMLKDLSPGDVVTVTRTGPLGSESHSQPDPTQGHRLACRSNRLRQPLRQARRPRCYTTA